MTDLILAIDQGTTGSTIALMDTDGRLLTSVNHEFPQIFPQPGWVEHDPESIWQSVLKGLTAVFSDTEYTVSQVAAIGITNQRETAVLWDSQTGDAVHNAIVWQCRRTTDVCEGLKAAGHEALIKAKSGLVLDPYFSATKFKWLLDNAPQAKALLAEGRLLAGTIDTYLMWRLSNGKAHKTDVSNASRTSLMSLETLEWDDELLDVFCLLCMFFVIGQCVVGQFVRIQQDKVDCCFDVDGTWLEMVLIQQGQTIGYVVSPCF